MKREKRLLAKARAEAEAQHKAAWREDQALKKANADKALGSILSGYTPKRVLRKADGHWSDHVSYQTQIMTTEIKSDYHELLRCVEQKTDRLNEMPQQLAMLASVPWVRPPFTWKVIGKSPATVLGSLVRHLLVKYPVPGFLFHVFNSHETWPNPWPGVFAALARGESFSDLIAKELFPIPLSRKQCHLFLQNPHRMDVWPALRYAQMGTSPAVAVSLCHGNTLSKFGNDKFWHNALGWLGKQGMFPMSQVRPLVDYLQTRALLDYSFKGRTIGSVLKAMEDWHREINARNRAVYTYSTPNVPAIFVPSGFKEGEWFEEKKDGNGRKIRTDWAVGEILTSRALADEGTAMRHCVTSYGYKIATKGTSVWSLLKDGARSLTIEVNNETGTIVQARGCHNRTANASELNALLHWAKANQIGISRYL